MNLLSSRGRCSKFILGLPTLRSKLTSCNWYSLTVDAVNPNVRAIEYAMLGPITMRALQIRDELTKGVKKPFSEVLMCNAGDSQANGQAPVTFLRQVVALCSYPALFDDKSFPDDAKQRAKRILQGCSGFTIGSYGFPSGIDVVRHDITNYIERRDAIPSRVDDIIVTTGGSEVIDFMLNMMSNGGHGQKKTGVMLPVPVYSLYTAYTSKHNVHNINYYLDESNNWNLQLEELERSLKEGRECSQPKAIVVINPGNPTGQLLGKNDIETVICFSKKHNLTIIADEVYQGNVYGKREFISFKKVLHEMGSEYQDVEIISLMSASKGVYGECGFRGGYMELLNTDESVRKLLLTNLSTRTCAPIPAQVVVDAVVNPPKEGEESYDLYKKETSQIFNDLRRNAEFVSQEFNKIPGYSCNEVTGAIYAFPKIEIPLKAQKAAEEAGIPPDTFYTWKLLEECGICVVPGSGFGQIPGTYHLRFVISTPLDVLKKVVSIISEYQKMFLAKYS